MEILKTLAVALSLGTLAGVNLYLTVFVTGLAVRMDWVALPGPLQGLEVLAHPVVLAVAGVMYLVEFFADKVPWVDTAWDAVHTVIRPVGAAALAVAAMGDAHPVFEVVAALLAGGMALGAHTAKAGTRLAANTSPEPFSNIGLSFAEDALVVGGLGVLAWNPLVALLAAVLAIAAIVWFLPRIVNGAATRLWFAWKKLKAPPEGEKPAEPLPKLPDRWNDLLHRTAPGKSAVEWTLPCVSGKGDLLAANVKGWIVSLSSEPAEIYFLGRTWRGGVFAAMDLAGAGIDHTSGFLADRLEIRHRDGRPAQAFFIDASFSIAGREAASRLRDDAGLASKPA
jgi:hypothetical protein